MGLDWYFKQKPRHGCEDEFERVSNKIKELHRRAQIDKDSLKENQVIVIQLQEEIMALDAKLEDELSISVYETSNCQRSSNRFRDVPFDWPVEYTKHEIINTEETQMFLKDYCPLIGDDEDGRLAFATSNLCYHFRAQFLKSSEFFPDELKEELYKDRSATECIEFANKIERCCAIKFKGYTDLFGKVDNRLQDFKYEKDKYDEDLDVCLKWFKRAVEFLRWYGSHGHSLEISF